MCRWGGRLAHLILGIGLAVGPLGCGGEPLVDSGSGKTALMGVDETSADTAHAVESTGPSPTEAAEPAAPELPAPPTGASPPTDDRASGESVLPDAEDETPAAHAPDPGAVALVATIERAIGAEQIATDGTLVAVESFRNQSRAPHDELEELRRRIVTLLAPAAEGRSIRFSGERSEETEYTLGGTAYLLTRDGFDQWEVYFALKPRGANWSVWRNHEPVRLLRQPRVPDRIDFTPDL